MIMIIQYFCECIFVGNLAGSRRQTNIKEGILSP